MNVLADAIAPEVSLPFAARAPDHASEAVQPVTLADVQDSEVLCPATTEVGAAVSVSVGVGGGGGALTLTDALCAAVPPVPVHVSVKDVVACKATVDSVPDVALLPDQPPLAEQVDALADVQDSEALCPATTEVGVAVSVSVGVGGGGGALTVTVALRVVAPPEPVHASVKVVVACKATVDSEPDVPLFPDQPPLAEQAEAFVLVQARVAFAPWFTVAGFAARETVGGTVGCERMATLAVALVKLPKPTQPSV